MESFSDRFRRARKWEFNSQDALAEKLGGVARQTIGDWENGRTYPDADQLSEFCKVTGAHPYWLLFGEGPEKLEEAGEADYASGQRELSEKVREALDGVLIEGEPSGLPSGVVDGGGDDFTEPGEGDG